MEEMLGRIVNTTQVPQAPSAFKSQIEIVLDVGDFHLTPNMTIVLAIHALHLSRMTSWKTNGRQFKDDVIVECDGQRINIMNFDRAIPYDTLCLELEIV
jgi:hypothetical protein